jgi:hypothetical protein
MRRGEMKTLREPYLIAGCSNTRRPTEMPEMDERRFTIGVFQDVTWAERGIEALKQQKFVREALSLVARESPEAAALVERALGGAPARLVLPHLGTVVATGSLIEALDGSAGDLAKLGLAAAMKRVGFQSHDGQIFEALTAKGGVLVAIEGEPRAADALAVLHSFGGGNAAIGAWTGRV